MRTECNKTGLLYERIALNNQSDPELGLTLDPDYTEACIWYNRQGTTLILIMWSHVTLQMGSRRKTDGRQCMNI